MIPLHRIPVNIRQKCVGVNLKIYLWDFPKNTNIILFIFSNVFGEGKKIHQPNNIITLSREKTIFFFLKFALKA